MTVDCGLHEYQHDHVNTGHTGHQCHTCSADTGPNLSRTRGQIQGKNSQPLFAASRSQWRFGKWLNLKLMRLVNQRSTQHNSFRNFRNLKMQVLATIYIIIRIIKNKVCRCVRPKCEYCHGSSSSGGVCAVFTRHDNILSGCPMLRVRLLFIMSILSPVNKYYHTYRTSKTFSVTNINK